MLIYSIIVFLVAIVVTVFGIAIYNGNTKLIHSYHQKKVTDKAAYGKAFGKSLFIVAAAPLLSGIVGLLGDSDTIAVAAVVILTVGICIGICFLVAVQMKYNKGIF